MHHDYDVVRVIKIVDGDTMDCEIDLGFGMHADFRFRLAGANAPEMSTVQGPIAKQYAINWFATHPAAGNKLVAFTHRYSAATVGIGDGLYGRWVAFFREVDPSETIVVADFTADLLAANVGAVVLDPWTP